jgi:hypothetical protein
MADLNSIDTYKTVRNWLWLVFAIVWIVGCYWSLDADRAAQLAKIQDCAKTGGLSGTVCATSSYFGVADAVSSGVFGMQMLLVIVASPLMFLPARFAARMLMRLAFWLEIYQEKRARKSQQRLQRQASQKRIAQSEAETSVAREKNSRTEVIMKLGSINDLVDVMEVETDQQRLMTIRLGVAQALRELAAKYDIATLGTIVRSDDAAHITARHVIQRLERSPLSDLVELHLLQTAVGQR